MILFPLGFLRGHNFLKVKMSISVEQRLLSQCESSWPLDKSEFAEAATNANKILKDLNSTMVLLIVVLNHQL